jgi:hypothetical protein
MMDDVQYRGEFRPKHIRQLGGIIRMEHGRFVQEVTDVK